jgi:hypothetical protein
MLKIIKKFLVVAIIFFQGCATLIRTYLPKNYSTQIGTQVYKIKGSVIAKGYGLMNKSNQEINIIVPGVPKKAFLYWAGRNQEPLGEEFLFLNGKKIRCSLIYGEKPGAPPPEIQYIFTYRADITRFIKKGRNNLKVWGFNAYCNEGMGIVVIYKDESLPLKEVMIKEGMGFFWAGLENKDKRNSKLVSYDFKPSYKERAARMIFMVAGGEPSPRDDYIWDLITKDEIKGKNIISKGKILFKNAIESRNGKQWDTLDFNLPILVDSRHLYFQIESPIKTASIYQGDSLNFVASILELPLK